MVAGMAPVRQLKGEQTVTDKQRIDRLEAAVNGLAFLESRLAAIPPGLCPELDAIRAERAGSVGTPEIRPSNAPERRQAVA
jgi:hypothetical protein